MTTIAEGVELPPLTVVVTVENIRSAAGNDIVSTRGDVSTVDGEPVLSAYGTLVVRGAGA